MNGSYEHSIDVDKTRNIMGDVTQLITDVETDMADLYKIIGELVEHSIVFDWSEELKATWDQLYDQKVKGVIAEMKDTVSGTETTIDNTIRYSNSN